MVPVRSSCRGIRDALGGSRRRREPPRAKPQVLGALARAKDRDPNGQANDGRLGGRGSAPEQSPAANERLSKPAMLDTQTCAKDSCLWRLCSPARERPAFSRSPSRGCRPDTHRGSDQSKRYSATPVGGHRPSVASAPRVFSFGVGVVEEGGGVHRGRPGQGRAGAPFP